MRVSLSITAKDQLKAVASILKTDLRDERVEAIVSIELAVYGMRKLLPVQLHTTEQLPYLFTGTFYPYLKERNEDYQLAWQNLQILLPKFKAKRYINETLRCYLSEPLRYLHVAIDDYGVFYWQPPKQGESRADAYERILSSTLAHKPNLQTFVISEKKISYYDEFNRITVSTKLPEYLIDKKVSLIESSLKRSKRLEISKEELMKSAKEMDVLDQKKGVSSDWQGRIQNLQFSEWSESRLMKSENLIINGTQHWLGTLSAGKTTIMDVIAYHVAKHRNGKTVLVVGDVTAVLEKVDMFHKMDIKCVPIISANERKKHVEQYFYSLQKEFESLDELKRPAMRYLTDVCLVQSLQDMNTTARPPCFHMEQGGVKKLCPYFHQCEYHHAFHDLPDADVIVSTIQGLVLSSLPPAISESTMRMLEYVLRQTDLILVDEADRVQSQLDDMFAPTEDIAGTEGSWLENIHDKINNYLRKDKTCLQKPHVSEWIRAVHNAMGATIHIYGQLHQEKSIFDFVGKQFFTGYKLIKQFLAEIFDFEDFIEEAKEKTEFYHELHDRFQKLIQNVRSNEEFGDLVEFEESPSLYFAYHAILDQNADMYLELFLKQLAVEYLFPKDHLQRLQNKLKFALSVLYLENRLFYLIHNFEGVQADLGEALANQSNLYSIFKGVPRDYDGIVPTAPTGIWLGFQYVSDEKAHAKNGAFKLMRYIGVGRHVLTNLSSLFSKLDGCNGADAVLLSGTSYLPGSPKYHVDVPVSYIVERKNDQIPRIAQTFTPAYTRNNEPLKISGKKGESRFETLRMLARRTLTKEVLENELKRCPTGRERILLVVGSYVEAWHVANELRKNADDSNQIYHLVKENAVNEEGAWPRQKVSLFAKSGGNILVAPLMALERGHNILTENDGRKVAAFSTALFLVRPFPRPYDTSRVVNRINEFALKAYKQSTEHEDLKGQVDHIRKTAYIIQKDVIRGNKGFQSMDEDEKRHLILDLFVNIWQLIGRLIRGGVDARILYVDASFAPKSAIKEADSSETSLLLAMKDEFVRKADSDIDSPIIKVLFDAMINGLDNLEGVIQNDKKEDGYENYA
ncbi:hypothetical protein EYB31_06495 [Paenibacillus thalictri]|uniref:pPIWI-RE three-gene island domain-containing protein n=1 Tax=Paenibacillus thalictri TaxID=2527873 RepID=A0A4Q9DZZ4_9BACL|nr:hypothetical protein EYB31_06495 [Paenibacillus thalictri]